MKTPLFKIIVILISITLFFILIFSMKNDNLPDYDPEKELSHLLVNKNDETSEKTNKNGETNTSSETSEKKLSHLLVNKNDETSENTNNNGETNTSSETSEKKIKTK